jgi:hypothetical protein
MGLFYPVKKYWQFLETTQLGKHLKSFTVYKIFLQKTNVEYLTAETRRNAQ